MMRERTVGTDLSRDEFEPPVFVANQEQQPYDFSSFRGALHEFQQSVDNRFQLMDERVQGMHEQMNDMQQDWDSHASTMVTKLDDISSIAQQQFEVLYHRQVMMQMELDKCNKMAVYYHTPPGPPKPQPTSAQLAGYVIPNLSLDDISGAVHELPPGVPSRSSLKPLPSFGRIPQAPPTPTF